MSAHRPLDRQRSPWEERRDLRQELFGCEVKTYMRRVHDGLLVALAGREPAGWHLSISFRDHRGELTRYPTWDEQVHAVRSLLPPELTYCMILPPDGEDYVSLHDTTFHWHEYEGADR